MGKIQNHVRKLSFGLKSRLAILSVTIVVLALSSALTVAGLYLYFKNHQVTKPTQITKVIPTKIPVKTTATTTVAKTDTPKPKPVVKPVVVVKPVAPAPTSSVDALTAAPSTTPPVVPPTPPAPDPGVPAPNPVRVSSTKYSSTNWSGYLATGGNFTTVSGSWVVPSVTGTAGITSSDGAWIGIGGVTAGDLVQIGTLNQVNPDGSVITGVFYETLPASAVIVDMPIAAGDLISASVSETSLNQWSLTITDVTNGRSFSKALAYTSSHSSAEWVQEDPSYSGGGLVPLDNFSPVVFSGCRSTVDTYLYNIADIGASPITMMSHGLPVAIPSAISGSGFSVVRN